MRAPLGLDFRVENHFVQHARSLQSEYAGDQNPVFSLRRWSEIWIDGAKFKVAGDTSILQNLTSIFGILGCFASGQRCEGAGADGFLDPFGCVFVVALQLSF